MFVLARCENASSQLHSFFDIDSGNCEFKLDDIIQPFLGCHAKTLAGKPKVIIIHVSICKYCISVNQILNNYFSKPYVIFKTDNFITFVVVFFFYV